MQGSVWQNRGNKAAASAVMSSWIHVLLSFSLGRGSDVLRDECFQKSLQCLSSPFSSFSLETVPLSLLGSVWEAALYGTFCLILVCSEKWWPGRNQGRVCKHTEEMGMRVRRGVWHRETTLFRVLIYDRSYLKLLLPSGLHKFLFSPLYPFPGIDGCKKGKGKRTVPVRLLMWAANPALQKANPLYCNGDFGPVLLFNI